ncbi:MAG: Xaa-Pro peptidase family protein [Pygmaiobacter massiliensis]|nr:Xaa-Pro peptidase family protein [Pygmaiobacter massiliensis]
MQNRIEKLVQALPQDFEAALIETPANRFYFLDLDTDDAGQLVIFRDGATFFIDSRYLEIARSQVKTAQVVEQTAPMAQLAALLAEHKVGRLHLESDTTLHQYAALQKALPEVELVGDDTLSRTVRKLRSVKDLQELERIRKAQQITDDCFTYIWGQIRTGMRQIDLALLMESYMRSHGAQGVAFPTIFISGPDTSKPHGVPGERVLAEGDFITMDYGAKYGGYCTDMTRTVALGSVSSEMEQVYQVVLQAQLAAVEAVVPGAVCSQVDAVARDRIKQAGFGAYFGHGLGHAVGIEIHEEPRFSPSCQEKICPGQLITVEPGIYLPGRFGVRIEDTVLVTDSGHEILGKSTKNLVIL